MADQGTYLLPFLPPSRFFRPKICHSHTFSLQKELPYPLISDPNRLLIAALGAKENGKTKRSHFIFEKGGKLVDKRNPVTPTERCIPPFFISVFLYMRAFVRILTHPSNSPPAALEFVKSYNTKASL